MIFPSASKQSVKEKTSASWDDYTRLSFINCMREEKATAKTIGDNGFTRVYAFPLTEIKLSEISVNLFRL